MSGSCKVIDKRQLMQMQILFYDDLRNLKINQFKTGTGWLRENIPRTDGNAGIGKRLIDKI